MMRRWLPFPLFSFGLWLMWLMLNQSLAPGQLLLGALLALAAPLLGRPLGLRLTRPARPRAVVRLFIFSLIEIIRSCHGVSLIILGRREHNSQFIRVPLTLRDPTGLAVLACIINSTPGTVWIEILPEGHQLALHVLDLHDEQWWIDTIHRVYEQPLLEIFESGEAR